MLVDLRIRQLKQSKHFSFPQYETELSWALFESRCRWGIKGEGKNASVNNCDGQERADPAKKDLENKEGIQILRPAKEANSDCSADLALGR